MKKRNIKQYLSVSICSAFIGIIVAIVMAVIINNSLPTGLGAGSSDDTEEIVQRAAMVQEATTDSNFVSSEVDESVSLIDSGFMTAGDYCVFALTSSDYLMQNKDDVAFATDLCNVLYGSSDESKISEIKALLTDSSRKYVIAQFAEDLSKNDRVTCDVSNNGYSSFSDCNVTNSIEGDDGITFGIRLVEGSFSVTGDEVRTDFYVDGTLYQGALKITNSDEGKKNFTMAWDTTGVVSGSHDVKILLRSSDGRGQVITGGNVTIPECTAISNDTVLTSSILDGNSSSWYIFNSQDRDAYVNFLDMSDDIAVSIYDVNGELIGTNDIPDSDYEILRAKLQDVAAISEETGISGISNIYYIRVDRGSTCTDLSSSISYTMVQSQNVAKYNGGYVAVTNVTSACPTPLPITGYSDSAEVPDTVSVIDATGAAFDVERGNLDFLPLNGFLTKLKISDANTGNVVDVYPDFETDELNYGYYVDDVSEITINATSQDGYSGQLEISGKSGSASFSPISQGQVITLVPGESTYTIKVTAFDGTVNSYNIYILNGNDEGDFFENTLNTFPESYYSGLWMLHSIHPEYSFVAYNTGLDYMTVLDNEDNVDRSLANVTTNPEWVADGSEVYDGGGWMTANYDTVNYFLDPRNFLTQKYIFQFELLAFDEEAQTIEGVRNMISGSFMDTDEYDYAQIIYDAGRTANVSPYFLASRILQEMGYNGESDLCHGTLEGYEGYYNFYNIGSTPDPDIENGALINGARYAQWGKEPDEEQISDEEAALMLPWTTPERAITGGALWIASRYTDAGQTSLYFQKFDVINNDDGLYEHQYAQNISMAYTEGARYFGSYASINMLGQSFEFVIPVYENMPADYGYLPQPAT